MERALIKIAIAALTIVSIVLSYPTQAFADKFNTETSAETRLLGMGNAGVNLSRGPHAVFYNPANIAAKDTGVNIQAVNLQLDASEGLVGMSGIDALSFTSLNALVGKLKKDPNTFVGGRYSVYPNVTMRNISVGLLYESSRGAVYRAYDGALRVLARDRFAPTAALSYRLFGGMFRFGASAQLLTVGNADATTGPPVPNGLDYGKFINSRSGLVTTGGVTVSIPFRYLPSFSLVARNIGNTRFTSPPLIKFGNNTSVPTQLMTFDFGSSMTMYLGRRLEMKLAFDYRDVTNRLKGNQFRRMFTGGEFVFYDFLRLRAGMQHGYMSYGLGIFTPKTSLDFAIYADELDDRLRGTAAQRYVVQYTWGLF